MRPAPSRGVWLNLFVRTLQAVGGFNCDSNCISADGSGRGSRNNPIRPDCIQRFLAEVTPVLADADERRRLLDMDSCCMEPVPMLVSTAEIGID